MKDGKCNKNLDKLAIQPIMNAEADVEPSSKTILTNDIFTESE